MLSKVVDSERGELENQYNDLGFRVLSTRPEERIEYLCDLSRDCYNMLERTVNGETESFIYDKNVITMSKAENTYYYLQDELGSPMYMTGTDGVAVSSYAFDDFGRGIDPFTGKIKEASSKQHTTHAYTTDGNIIQPFAFTGYQEDEFSGLKFAQARFYNAENGRFVTADKIKGFAEYPLTINAYLYCIDNPTNYVDEDGNFLHTLIGAGIGAAISTGMEIYNQVKTGEKITDGGLLKDLFNYAISGAADAGEAWGLLASYVGQETVQSYVSAEVTSGATSLYEEGIKYVEQCIL
ncbi:MAG: RHS repeat-associated core domain-containing protein [Butyrivibrio sp.]|uniref:RHS repeat-associated core domain-containing protein n=1 Tax=Butyrivibrio sp. TaxID=28121 RepID=UPI0025FD8CBF|nr:RHS repeat-associated core domain-containing protein [Butyrivibrio sp.]MCR5772076.1 RHS repeat-associated core domain-containing protein [Butyrivibrio sp.]